MSKDALTRLVDDYLYPRQDAKPFLGNPSIPTLRKLERDGILKPIRLTKGPTSTVHYLGKNIRKARQGDL